MQLGLVIKRFWMKKEENILITIMESKMTKSNNPDKIAIENNQQVLQGQERTDPL